MELCFKTRNGNVVCYRCNKKLRFTLDKDTGQQYLDWTCPRCQKQGFIIGLDDNKVMFPVKGGKTK